MACILKRHVQDTKTKQCTGGEHPFMKLSPWHNAAQTCTGGQDKDAQLHMLTKAEVFS